MTDSELFAFMVLFLFDNQRLNVIKPFFIASRHPDFQQVSKSINESRLIYNWNLKIHSFEPKKVTGSLMAGKIFYCLKIKLEIIIYNLNF